jgi:hypothetical protein
VPGQPVGAQPFDHRQDAGAVGGQADVVADGERAAGQQVRAGQFGQFQRAGGRLRQQAEGAQRRPQHHEGPLRQAEVFAQAFGGDGPAGQPLEDAEVGDGRGQQFGAVVAAENVEDGRRVERRGGEVMRVHGGGAPGGAPLAA